MKCPKCQADYPETAAYCADCGTRLTSQGEIPVTRTIETPVQELTTGSTFAERYQIIEELGIGGMGSVYKVQDTEIKEKVALKLLKPEIASDEKTIERFRNELKLARKIVHKNVGRMYDLGKEKSTYYITMEFVPGEDLKSFIRRSGQLAVGTTIKIATQICSGLAEAHKLGVIHRDLKPSNIMIDKEGNARIMDFGIARTRGEKGITGAGVMIGTPEYMSPEQAEAKEVDHLSDIYSFGVILFEMLTGRLPFEGDTPLSIAMKHKGEIPPNPKKFNAQIPDTLGQLILKCMEKSREDRYQIAEDVQADLDNIVKGMPTTELEIPKKKPITSREITVTLGLKKLVIPALVIMALAIIAVVLWQFLPQKEAVVAPKIENSIAVISFENQTGDKAYDYLQKAIPNLLITDLEQLGFLYVITWERMHDILKQMGEEDVEVIDREMGFEICDREGVEAIVLGSFIKAGDTFATDVKVLNVETKRLIKSASSKGKSIDSIIDRQIDELSQEISQSLGITRQKIEATQARISDVTTPSIEAYNYFLKGREAYEKFYFKEAQQYLDKAVELDPTFASAYLYLSWSHNKLGSTLAMNEALVKAKTYSEKATEKERLYINASYTSVIEKNPDNRLRIYEEMAIKYPKEKRVHLMLGTLYKGKRSFSKSIEEHNKALELDPDYGIVMNEIAYTYTYLKNYEKAIEYFKKYASVSPGDANPHDSLGDLYFRMGMLDESITKYKEALKIKPDLYLTPTSIGYIYALRENYSEAMKWIENFLNTATSPGWKAEGYLWKAFFHFWLGRFEQSLDDLNSATNLAETVGNVVWRAFAEWTKAWIYFERREFELSRKHFKRWFDFMKEYQPSSLSQHKANYNFQLGLLDLKQGRIDSAKSRLIEIESLLPEIDSPRKDQFLFRFNILNGEMLLAENSVEKAISVFEGELPLELPTLYSQHVLAYNAPFEKDLLGRAYHQNGELDKAIDEYEQLVTFDPTSNNRRLIHPKYHYRLAMLYEEKGWEGKAIDQYRKFLYLWKDADPGLAEVEDARKRLAGLKKS